MRLLWLLLAVFSVGYALAMTTPAADSLPAPHPAPLRLTLPGTRLSRVATPPDLDAADPLTAPAFAQAQPLGRLYTAGQPEPAAQTTTLRLVLCDQTLYLAAECRDTRPPQPYTGDDATGLWQGDALEIFLSGAPAAATSAAAPATTPDAPPPPLDTPYTQLAIAANGRAVAWRYSTARRGADDSATEGLSTAAVKIRTGLGPNGNGWWLVAAIPADPFAPDLAGLRGNFARDHAAGPAGSWCDMDGGSAHQPDRFAPLTPLPHAANQAAEPTPVPELLLPVNLAVGNNHLTVLNPAKGFLLVCGDLTLPLDRETLDLPMVGWGDRQLVVRHADGAPAQIRRQYDCHLRRPFFIEAVKPFATDLDQPIDIRLSLNIAVDQPIPVTVEARQQGKLIGSLKLDAGAGLQTVAVPLENAQSGEISLHAVAVLPAAAGLNGRLNLVADHLCLRGHSADDFNRFRDGLDALDLRQRYRAMFSDAAGFYRLIQAGDGRVRSISRRGDTGFTEWNYGAAYIFAVAYTADWPENPHKGDPRFLTAALHALEAGIDPEAKMPAGGHSRHLRPLVLTYGLIEKDLDPATRAQCREQLTAMVAESVRTRLIPASRRYTLYSEDLGTGTNHFAYYCTGVLAAGRVLNRPDWTALATAFLTRLADHGRDGQFPERPGVSASHYTWLTLHALGQFYADTQDPRLLPVLQNCAAYAVHTSLPVKAPYLLHDGRNNDFGGGDCGGFVLSLTPQGRALARQQQLQHSADGRRPSNSSPEFWYRTADDAMYAQTGDTAPLPDPAEFTFLSGRALLARRSGFAYGLSTLPLPPTSRTYWLDPQNFLELHSLSLGPILCGANSQQQPEAGSFQRTLNGRTEFLPVEGTLAKLPAGHASLLQFPSFNARVAITVQDARHARVTVQILNCTGTEPVTFNFFPGVAKADDLQVSADGKTLTFGPLKIQCSAAPTLDRNFKIMNPYSQKFTTGTKPVRAHVDLTDNTTYTLDLEQP